ncbi:MAG: FadR/GntR family transcriptional regulator [Planctomycetota bacterium]
MIAGQLIQLILKEFEHGDKLPSEKELCELFQVGRSSFREALRALELMGCVETRNGEGTFVTKTSANIFKKPLDWGILDIGRSMPELLEARRVLESALVKLAVTRVTPDQLRDLEEALRAMEQAGMKNRQAFIQADLRFHEILAASCGNSILYDIMNITRHILRQDDIRGLRKKDEVELSLRLHRKILQAMTKGDAGMACKALDDHMDWMEKLFST